MWYDFFSLFYDRSLERLYRRSRSEAIAELGAMPGCCVLDVACGTGQNFPFLLQDVADGTIVGVDASTGMLRRAQKRIEENGWSNVHLVCGDIHHFTESRLFEIVKRRNVDYVICSLGMTVIPEWEAALRHCYSLLATGGRIALFDVYASKRTFHTRFGEIVARSDVSRQFWYPLEEWTSDFSLIQLEGSPKTFGGNLFVASGTKH